MTRVLEILPAAALLMMIVWTAISGLTALLYSPVRGWLDSIALEERRPILLSIAALPLVVAVLTTLSVFVPTTAHCHASVGCGAHSPAQWVVPGNEIVFGIIAVLAGAVFALRTFIALGNGLRCAYSLGALTPHYDVRGFWVVTSHQPLALSTGWWRGKVFLSAGLLEAIGDRDIQVISDHEAAHVRCKHNFVHLVTLLLFCPLSSRPVRTLLRDLRESSEQLADREAAVRAGPEGVAETLVRVHRLGLRESLSHLAHFHPSSLERRIGALFAGRAKSGVSGIAVAAMTTFALAATAIGIDAGHHFLESLMHWIYWI